jgi:hypothetical protein
MIAEIRGYGGSGARGKQYFQAFISEAFGSRRGRWRVHDH